MKRIVRILAVYSIAVFVLAGCQDKSPSAKKLDELKRAASQTANDLQQGASSALEDAGKAAEELLNNIKK